MRVFVGVAAAILSEVVGVEARQGDRAFRGGGSFVALGFADVVADPFLIVLAGIVTPRIFPWRFGVEREFGFGECEQGRGMHVGRARRLLDDFGARVLGARAQQNAQARSDLLDPGFRQATEEVFPRHIADVGVGAEGVDRDARDTPAVGWEEAEALFFGAARR